MSYLTVRMEQSIADFTTAHAEQKISAQCSVTTADLRNDTYSHYLN